MSMKRASVIESNILQKIRRVVTTNDENASGHSSSVNLNSDLGDSYWDDWELNSNSDDDINYDSDEGEISPGFPGQAGYQQESDEAFAVRLAAWCISSGTARDKMDDLLCLLRQRSDLPKSTKTLLHTPSTKISPKPITNGAYLHFGIEKMLIESEYRYLRETSEIVLQIGFDGVPLYKSSGTELWPLLGKHVGCKGAPIILIGLFAGVGKPGCVNSYFEDFTNEVEKLQRDGVCVTADRLTKPFYVTNFIADTPARSFGAGRHGHTCARGCHMCTQVGRKINNRMAFQTVRGSPRTDTGFLLRSDPGHHLPEYINNPTILETAGFGMVTQFPLGPMHLFDLGNTKKYLKLLLLNYCHGFNVTTQVRDTLERTLLSFATYVPVEFARKPRTLKEVARWKATEFRLFGLYIAVVAFRKCLNDDLYYHFMHYTCAYRLISTPDAQTNASVANTLLERFVENYAIIFGEDRITSNVHNLLHICECVERYGDVNNFVEYPFENFLQTLKKLVRNPSKILSQVHNRISEMATINRLAQELKIDISNSRIPFPSCTSTKDEYSFNEFVIKTTRADAYCQIYPNVKFEIHQIGTNGSEDVVIGKRFRNCKPFFTTPLNSMEVGIFECQNLSDEYEVFAARLIQNKFVNLPFGSAHILIAMLHHL